MVKDEAVAEEIPYLVQDIIPEQSVGVLAGLPQAHKTWVGLHLAYCIGTGNPFLGRFNINKTAPALYLAFEGSLPTLKRRVQKIIFEDAPNVLVWSVTGSLLYSGITAGMNNTQRETQSGVASLTLKHITDVAKEAGVKLIVIDTFRASFVGNENDSGDVANYLNKINKLQADTGASILLLHHTGKNTGESIDYHDSYKLIRGSSALVGSVDYVLGLQYDKENSDPEVEDVLVLSQAKSRDAPQQADLEIHMREEEGKIKFRSTFLESKIDAREKEIRELIIAELTEFPKAYTTITQHPARLGADGKIHRNIRERIIGKLTKEGIVYEQEGKCFVNKDKIGGEND
jgi:RecA-family ATPase